MIITKLLFLLSRKPNELWLFVRELIWLVHLNGQRLFHTIKPEFYSHLTPSQTSNPNWSGHLLAGCSTELTLSLFRKRVVVPVSQQSRSPSLQSSGRNVRLWDNPFQGGIWLAVEINAQFNLSQDSWLPSTDYPRASRSFPRIAGSGNEIGVPADLDPSHNGPPGPNPLANMGLWGSSPRVFYHCIVLYFEYCIKAF
jgi:hypothetical protein